MSLWTWIKHLANLNRISTSTSSLKTDTGNRKRITKMLNKIGAFIESETPDRFNDSEFERGRPVEFPEIPGEATRNRELIRIREVYSLEREANGSPITSYSRASIPLHYQKNFQQNSSINELRPEGGERGARASQRPPNPGIHTQSSGSSMRQLDDVSLLTTGNAGSVTIDPLTGFSDIFVLFGVKGSERSLEVAQIKVSRHRDSERDDEEFFTEIREHYNKLRGRIRRWLSMWKLRYCDFVEVYIGSTMRANIWIPTVMQFKKVQSNRVFFRKEGLPGKAEQYEYTPQPPDSELPPISPNEFEYALLPQCSQDCLLSGIHHCVEQRKGYKSLQRIPKRKSQLLVEVDEEEKAWGIQAHYTPHFLTVLSYHIMILAGPFAFWAWWQIEHPDDLQNASALLTATTSLVAIFWSCLIFMEKASKP